MRILLLLLFRSHAINFDALLDAKCPCSYSKWDLAEAKDCLYAFSFTWSLLPPWLSMRACVGERERDREIGIGIGCKSHFLGAYGSCIMVLRIGNAHRRFLLTNTWMHTICSDCSLHNI